MAEAVVRLLDLLSCNAATHGVRLEGDVALTGFVERQANGLRVGALDYQGSREPGELDRLIEHLGGEPSYFDAMAQGDLGFVTNRAVEVEFHEGCRLMIAKDSHDTLMVRSPSVHAYKLLDGGYAALIYTEDNGALWVTNSVGGDQLALYWRAQTVLDEVQATLRAIKGDEKRTGADDYQSVSLPLVSGAYWQWLDWLQGAKAGTTGGLLNVAGMAQRFELSFKLDGVPQTLSLNKPTESHLAFTDNVLLFKTRPNIRVGGNEPPFLIEWLVGFNKTDYQVTA